MDFFAKRIARHLAKPGGGLWGFLARKFVLDNNRPLAEATFRALNVKPGENVLELGFGYGSGLTYALNNGLREYGGTLYGVDYSPTACEAVREEFASDIASGNMKILNEDVAKMSLKDATIDKVFHTNCFYFWPDVEAASKEISRVMKSGGVMVAGLNLNRLKVAEQRGLLTNWQFQPERYSDALSKVGFTDIRQENAFNEKTNSELRFIYAMKPN